MQRLVAEALGVDQDEDGAEDAVAYDLYSGVGLFSLPLARRYARVVAVEGGREAARYGRRNVQLNRVQNVEVVNQAVDTWVNDLPEDAARVLVDPPRVGLSGPVRQALLDRPPRRLTYVSCDSAHLGTGPQIPQIGVPRPQSGAAGYVSADWTSGSGGANGTQLIFREVMADV